MELDPLEAAECFSCYVTKPGGLYRARHQAEVADQLGMYCDIGGSIETGIGNAANLHLGASLRNAVLPSVCPVSTPEGGGGPTMAGIYYLDDLVTEPFAFVDGRVMVPSGPGLGIEVDRAKISATRYDTGRCTRRWCAVRPVSDGRAHAGPGTRSRLWNRNALRHSKPTWPVEWSASRASSARTRSRRTPFTGDLAAVVRDAEAGGRVPAEHCASLGLFDGPCTAARSTAPVVLNLGHTGCGPTKPGALVSLLERRCLRSRSCRRSPTSLGVHRWSGVGRPAGAAPCEWWTARR